MYTGLSLCMVPVRTYSPLMSWRLHPLSWKAVTSVLAVRARAVPAGLFAIASRTLVRTSAGRGERLNIEWSSAAPRPIAGQPLGSQEAEMGDDELISTRSSGSAWEVGAAPTGWASRSSVLVAGGVARSERSRRAPAVLPLRRGARSARAPPSATAPPEPKASERRGARRSSRPSR